MGRRHTNLSRVAPSGSMTPLGASLSSLVKIAAAATALPLAVAKLRDRRGKGLEESGDRYSKGSDAYDPARKAPATQSGVECPTTHPTDVRFGRLPTTGGG